MKGSIFLSILFGILISHASAQAIQFAKVEHISPEKGSKIYPILNGEVVINGNLIKRLDIGKSTAGITYFNKSTFSIKPKYVFRLIDAYGIEVASFEDTWAFQSIAAGETHQENKAFTPIKLERALHYSTVAIPKDWATPVYLIIEGSEP